MFIRAVTPIPARLIPAAATTNKMIQTHAGISGRTVVMAMAANTDSNAGRSR